MENRKSSEEIWNSLSEADKEIFENTITGYFKEFAKETFVEAIGEDIKKVKKEILLQNIQFFFRESKPVITKGRIVYGFQELMVDLEILGFGNLIYTGNDDPHSFLITKLNSILDLVLDKMYGID